MPHTTPTQAAAVLTESAEVIELARMLQKGGYRGPLAWAKKIIDWAASQSPTPALLGASVGEPSECSGEPNSCPENEGYGCHCARASSSAQAVEREALSALYGVVIEQNRLGASWHHMDRLLSALHGARTALGIPLDGPSTAPGKDQP